MRIKEFEVIDLRVPNLDSLLGSDPFIGNQTILCPYQALGGNGIEGISVILQSVRALIGLLTR